MRFYATRNRATRIIAFAAVATGLWLQVNGGAFATSKLQYMPPDLDYKTVCLADQRTSAPLNRDWTLWKGEPVPEANTDLLDIASEYMRGSDRVEKSIETGMRILKFVEDNKGVPQPRLDRIIGNALIAQAEDRERLAEGEARLLKALSGGVARAAFDLAEVYSSNGPTQLRQPLKARDYYRIAAASGDADGQLAYARLISVDPNATDDEKNLATDNALLGMIQRISAGDCHYMATIAFLYLRGELITQNYDSAAKWFEQYAETGDARIQERLGSLLSSRLVSEVEYDKAMDFMEAAAQQGRPFAALTIGKAKATGVGRDRDLQSAEEFLRIAADGGLNEANFWLARLYQAEFGGSARPDLAKERYELAILLGKANPSLAADYGEFLIKTVPGVSDPARALSLLEGAAAGGSGRAAAAVARLYLEQARSDASLYTKAEKYFRLAAELGKPEGARELSKMYACGKGVPLSVAKANEWNERAYYLGSGSALYSVGLSYLIDADPVVQAKGRTLLKQAALKGYPEAIGYAIAHYESGRDGVSKDPEAAARLLQFVDNSRDAEFKLDATLEIIKSRLRLAQSAEDIAAQFVLLDELIATGAPEASMLKAEVLSDSGKADPAQLRSLYQVAAESGDIRAMREYGLILLADPTVEVSIGRDWLRRAAEDGDVKSEILQIDVTRPDALQALETAVQHGQVCSVDEMVSVARAFASVIEVSGTEQAKFWLASAVEVVGKDADDLFKIGDAYRDGVAGPDEIATGQAFFQRSADLGRQTALRDLADGHLLGLWTHSSPEKAKELLTTLFHGGDLSAASKLIEAIADQQVPATIQEIEELLAAPVSFGQVGQTYLKLTRLDEAGAFGGSHVDVQVQWLNHAAADGDANAMIRLYRAYANGIGVPTEPETAIAWLLKAADAGDPRAATELAAAYEVGFGVPVDAAKAALWRSKSEPEAVQ